MALTLPYPSMTAPGHTVPATGTVDIFGAGSVHSYSNHNSPHAELLVNDQAVRDYINNTLEPAIANVPSLTQSRVEYIDTPPVPADPTWTSNATSIPIYPRLNLMNYVKNNFDFSINGVVSWYIYGYTGGAYEYLVMDIDTSAGNWIVYREGVSNQANFYRRLPGPLTSGVAYVFCVEYSLIDYSGLGTGTNFADYSNADLRPESLFFPASQLMRDGSQYTQVNADYDAGTPTYAVNPAYINMRKHNFGWGRVGSGTLTCGHRAPVAYWDPFRPVISYPRVGYRLYTDTSGSWTWINQ